MGDIANMTDCGGRVNGFRLLRWLRSRAEVERAKSDGNPGWADGIGAEEHRGRADMLTEMADDLEAEINPPDYPGDDDEDADEDEWEHGPCDDCGRVAPLKTVQNNGRAWKTCRECDERAGDDTVDLDDPAMTGWPEQVERLTKSKILFVHEGVRYTITPWPEGVANPHGWGCAVFHAGELIGGAVDGADVIYAFRDGRLGKEKERRS